MPGVYLAPIVPKTLAWMAAQGIRSYEMAEIGARGLGACLTEAFATATDDCDGVFLSVDIDVVDPGHAPGAGTPEPGGLTARELLDTVRRACLELPIVGVEVVEVSPPYDPAGITAALANRSCSRRCRRSPGAAEVTLGTPRCPCYPVADRHDLPGGLPAPMVGLELERLTRPVDDERVVAPGGGQRQLRARVVGGFALLSQANQRPNTKRRDIAGHLVASGSLHDSEPPTPLPPARSQE